jgi:hypothetical protein
LPVLVIIPGIIRLLRVAKLQNIMQLAEAWVLAI